MVPLLLSVIFRSVSVENSSGRVASALCKYALMASLRIMFIFHYVLQCALLYALSAGARYRYLSYGAMTANLKELARTYPQTLSVYSAADQFEVPRAGKCRSATVAAGDPPDVDCDILVAKIGRIGQPAILVLGSLHGDERLGSLAAYYLIQTLVKNSQHPHRDDWIARLVINRLIIVVPVPNPVCSLTSFSWYLNCSFCRARPTAPYRV